MVSRKDITDTEMKIINRIAKDTAYKWSAVNWEDVQSELYVHFFQEFKHMKRYRKDGVRGQRAFAKSMARAANAYAKKEQAVANGVKDIAEQTSGWPRKAVVDALPFIWETMPGIGGVSLESWHSRRDVATHVSLATSQFTTEQDASLLIYGIREALPKLSQKQQELLILKYRDGLTHKQIAEWVGSTPANVNMACHRAVSALHEKMATI